MRPPSLLVHCRPSEAQLLLGHAGREGRAQGEFLRPSSGCHLPPLARPLQWASGVEIVTAEVITSDVVSFEKEVLGYLFGLCVPKIPFGTKKLRRKSKT